MSWYGRCERARGAVAEDPGPPVDGGASRRRSCAGGSMKVRFRVSMLFAVAASCLCPLGAYAQGSAIRVVQWNVEDGEQAGEINAIVAQDPDIVFLQEV